MVITVPTKKHKMCSTHGWPIVEVEGGRCCLHQVVQDHLLGRRIVDVLPGEADEPFALVFHDGHILPLYCPACGEPDHIDSDPGEVLDILADLWVIAAEFLPADGESSEAVQLTLANDPRADPETATADDLMRVEVHLKSLSSSPIGVKQQKGANFVIL
jgi:hypothetical protein